MLSWSPARRLKIFDLSSITEKQLTYISLLCCLKCLCGCATAILFPKSKEKPLSAVSPFHRFEGWFSHKLSRGTLIKIFYSPPWHASSLYFDSISSRLSYSYALGNKHFRFLCYSAVLLMEVLSLGLSTRNPLGIWPLVSSVPSPLSPVWNSLDLTLETVSRELDRIVIFHDRSLQ